MPTAPSPADIAAERALAEQQIILLLQILWEVAAWLINPFASATSGKRAFTNLSRIPALIQSILSLVAALAVENFDSTHNLFYTLITTVLGPLGKTIGDDYTALLQDLFQAYNANLLAGKTADPARVDALAVSALEEASALGLGSRMVTMLFELFVPKRLNFMNWLGPQLAQFAGYEEIVALWRSPMLKAAIGNLAQYKANSEFLTAAPPATEARRMLARRIITPDVATLLEQWGGTMTAYQADQEMDEYRALQPRMFATLLLDQPFPAAQVQSALEFAGIRDADIAFLLPALELASTKNVRQQYLAAAVRSTELGTMTPADLDAAMDSLNFSVDAKTWVQLTVATRKLEQLAELYRKSISEAYRYGQITDAQYVPALEAIGIGAADAQAHYAIDSIAQRGRIALAAEKAEAALERKRTGAAASAAVASYRSGTIDDAALLAALIAAGVDPAIAAFQVTVAVERRQGPLVFVYGLELSRRDALILKENVSAVEDQYKKQLIADADAYAALAALQVPDANAKALIAAWAALKTKPTTTGELLPR